jgi:hypothetical protein
MMNEPIILSAIGRRVTDRMRLPEHETHRYIHELESLGLIKIQPRVSHALDEKSREFRLINITNKGLQELSSDQPQQ